jgi:hypothetical protein
MKRRWHAPGKSDPNQLRIDWNVAKDETPLPELEVTAEEPAKTQPKGPKARQRVTRSTGLAGNRVIARFPVPRPLPIAVSAGRFGRDEQGKPIRPASDEVRAITENLADKLIDMLDSLTSRPGKPAAADTLPEAFGKIIAAYAQDFGDRAARQLEVYARRQASLDESDRTDQGWRR